MKKVLVYPDYRAGNPYQKLLEQSLGKLGVDLIFSAPSATLLSLAKSILKNRIRILHLHWIDRLIGNNQPRSIARFKSIAFLTEMKLMKLWPGVRIVWTIHNLQSHESHNPDLELASRKKLARLADSIICHSQSGQKKIAKYYQVPIDKISIIPHGNFIDYYDHLPTRTESRKRLGLSKKKLVFLYFGLIRPYKGIDDMLASFKEIRAPNVQLLIVGKPSDKRLKKLILKAEKEDSRIKSWLKFIPDSQVPFFMKAADLIVLPYKKIFCSGSALLAMSFARPIVAPAIGDLKEVLDRKGALLYQPSSKNGLTRAMEKAPALNLKAMGQHNFQQAKKLSWDQIGEKTKKVYFK